MISRLRGAVGVCVITLISSQGAQAYHVNHGVWEATLQGRDLDGDTSTFEVYYDTALNITWLANANGNGAMTWDEATAWVRNLNVNGVTGWRLPSADVNGDGTVVSCAYGGVAGCEDNEMGFLYWEEGIGYYMPGPFANLLSVGNGAWSSTVYAPHPARRWFFQFNGGTMGANLTYTDFNNFTWAVRDGDVSAVPAPAAVWLFGSGLLGLISVIRKQRGRSTTHHALRSEHVVRSARDEVRSALER